MLNKKNVDGDMLLFQACLFPENIKKKEKHSTRLSGSTTQNEENVLADSTTEAMEA
jgi:hypothetical protein